MNSFCVSCECVAVQSGGSIAFTINILCQKESEVKSIVFPYVVMKNVSLFLSIPV